MDNRQEIWSVGKCCSDMSSTCKMLSSQMKELIWRQLQYFTRKFALYLILEVKITVHLLEHRANWYLCLTWTDPFYATVFFYQYIGKQNPELWNCVSTRHVWFHSVATVLFVFVFVSQTVFKRLTFTPFLWVECANAVFRSTKTSWIQHRHHHYHHLLMSQMSVTQIMPLLVVHLLYLGLNAM